MKVAILTSGGDCQGLNPTIRGVSKALYHLVPDVEIYGVRNGYLGLITDDVHCMHPSEFSNIIRLGGTILGTSRQSFKTMTNEDGSPADKVLRMIANYKKNKFDALVVLGGNGTQKTAHLLSENGVNVVFLPKTIDNDILGTDITFGFDSAVAKATDVLDSIHSTAEAHGRVLVVELMGHKVGWITLYAGIASGVDAILIPEIPYYSERVLELIRKRNKEGPGFTVIAISEGAMTVEESVLPREGWKNRVDKSGRRLVDFIQKKLESAGSSQEVRLVVPGYYQRGGEPTATDRVLCSRLGVKAAELIANRQFGYMVAEIGQGIEAIPMADVVGQLKQVSPDSDLVRAAKSLGICFGDN